MRHHVAAFHPRPKSGPVGIPEDEVHFFDADDPVVPPDFLFENGPGTLDWYRVPAQKNAAAFAWYASHFAPTRRQNLLLAKRLDALPTITEVAAAHGIRGALPTA